MFYITVVFILSIMFEIPTKALAAIVVIACLDIVCDRFFRGIAKKIYYEMIKIIYEKYEK